MTRAKGGTTLAEILKEATGEFGLTPTQIADGAGYDSRQSYYHLTGSPRTFPAPERLTGLARVTRRPVAEILLATARTVGMEVPPVPKIAWRLPAKLDKLSETDTVELLRLIGDFVAERTRRRPAA